MSADSRRLGFGLEGLRLIGLSSRDVPTLSERPLDMASFLSDFSAVSGWGTRSPEGLPLLAETGALMVRFPPEKSGFLELTLDSVVHPYEDITVMVDGVPLLPVEAAPGRWALPPDLSTPTGGASLLEIHQDRPRTLKLLALRLIPGEPAPSASN